MTQTLTAPATRVRMGQTVGYRDSQFGLRIYLYDLQSVAEARAEFGATREDAVDFVNNTTCNQCGIAACELRECTDCATRACACVVIEDDHDRDMSFCTDCLVPCLCRECNDDL